MGDLELEPSVNNPSGNMHLRQDSVEPSFGQMTVANAKPIFPSAGSRGAPTMQDVRSVLQDALARQDDEATTSPLNLGAVFESGAGRLAPSVGELSRRLSLLTHEMGVRLVPKRVSAISSGD